MCRWDSDGIEVEFSEPPPQAAKKKREVQAALRSFGDWVKMRFGSVDKGFETVSVGGRQSYEQFSALVGTWPHRPQRLSVRDLWKGVDADSSDYVTADEWNSALSGSSHLQYIWYVPGVIFLLGVIYVCRTRRRSGEVRPPHLSIKVAQKLEELESFNVKDPQTTKGSFSGVSRTIFCK